MARDETKIDSKKVGAFQYKVVNLAMEEGFNSIEIVDYAVKNFISALSMFHELIGGDRDAIRGIMKFAIDEIEASMNLPASTEEGRRKAMETTHGRLGDMGMQDTTIAKFVREKAFS